MYVCMYVYIYIYIYTTHNIRGTHSTQYQHIIYVYTYTHIARRPPYTRTHNITGRLCQSFRSRDSQDVGETKSQLFSKQHFTFDETAQDLLSRCSKIDETFSWIPRASADWAHDTSRKSEVGKRGWINGVPAKCPQIRHKMYSQVLSCINMNTVLDLRAIYGHFAIHVHIISDKYLYNNIKHE